MQTRASSIEFSDLMKLMEEANELASDEGEYAKVHVTLDFASARVFRGSSDEEAAIQPGIEVWGLGLPERYGYINVGTWGNISESSSNNFAFTEIDWYGTYYLPEVVDNLYPFIGFIEYTYPTSEIPANEEINFGIEYWIENLALGFTAYVGVGGDTRGDDYYDLWASYYYLFSRKIMASFDVLAGYYDPDTGPSGWNEGVVYFTIEYALNEVWNVGASMAYVVQFDDSVYEDDTRSEPLNDYPYGMLNFRASY